MDKSTKKVFKKFFEKVIKCLKKQKKSNKKNKNKNKKKSKDSKKKRSKRADDPQPGPSGIGKKRTASPNLDQEKKAKSLNKATDNSYHAF